MTNGDTPSEIRLSVGRDKELKVKSVSAAMPLLILVLVVVILFGVSKLADRIITIGETYISRYLTETAGQHNEIIKELKITNELLRVITKRSFAQDFYHQNFIPNDSTRETKDSTKETKNSAGNDSYKRSDNSSGITLKEIH
jgi:Sec-independent protein translocase protein TatA